jgi:predicted sugar kinase
MRETVVNLKKIDVERVSKLALSCRRATLAGGVYISQIMGVIVEVGSSKGSSPVTDIEHVFVDRRRVPSGKYF